MQICNEDGLTLLCTAAIACAVKDLTGHEKVRVTAEAFFDSELYKRMAGLLDLPEEIETSHLAGRHMAYHPAMRRRREKKQMILDVILKDEDGMTLEDPGASQRL